MAPPPKSQSAVLASLWALLSDPGAPVLRQTWPEPRDLSFLDALREEDPARAAELTLARDFVDGLLCVPVICVAGLLNAGKSSLVASFLSPEGRRRVLRGVGRASGTHRFTIWCPAAWEKNGTFRDALERLLASVFGEAPEPLAVEPAAAQDQQRQRGRLRGPLIAFDPELNTHGVCLLDCPDIQRHEEGDADARRVRREVLEAAGRLCSAVFVVLPRNQMEIQQVADVLEALPSAVRVLAINFCSGERAAGVAEEARAIWGGETADIYVAYDVRHRGYEDYTPLWDPNRRQDSLPAPDATPCFFLASLRDTENQPAAVGPDRDLIRFPARMPPDRLLQERQRAVLDGFRRQIQEGGDLLAARALEESERVRRAARSLEEEFAPLLERDGQTRIKLNPRLIAGFADAIRRAAPLDLKPFLWLSQKAGSAARAIRSIAQGVTTGIHERIREEGRRLGTVLADSRVDAEQIADRLRLWSAACRAPRDHDYWMPAAERILARFQQQEETPLPQKEWDERARELWREMPVWRARAAVMTAVLVAMAAVAALSVAGGPVLVALGAKSAALTVTAKELLVVIGLGSIAQGEAARRLDEWLRERVGARQRASLLAMAFDETGLPRTLLSNPDAAREIPAAPRRDGFASVELRGRLRVWLKDNWNRMRKSVEALAP